jgi:hypothetical protein
MGRRPADFIRQVTATKTFHPDGTTTVDKRPAVWTLAHRGFSGSGRLDIWVYPSQAIALRAGAQLALACGLDESDPQAVRLYQSGRYQAVLDRYEAAHPDSFLLRVQPAFLQDEDVDSPEPDTPRRSLGRSSD